MLGLQPSVHHYCPLLAATGGWLCFSLSLSRSLSLFCCRFVFAGRIVRAKHSHQFQNDCLSLQRSRIDALCRTHSGYIYLFIFLSKQIIVRKVFNMAFHHWSLVKSYCLFPFFFSLCLSFSTRLFPFSSTLPPTHSPPSYRPPPSPTTMIAQLLLLPPTPVLSLRTHPSLFSSTGRSPRALFPRPDCIAPVLVCLEACAHSNQTIYGYIWGKEGIKDLGGFALHALGCVSTSAHTHINTHTHTHS